jgi:hypothetical protein
VNVFLLGLRVTAAAVEEDKIVNILAESLPSSDKRVATKVQLKQQKDHYVGKLLQKVEKGQTILAIGPTRPTPEGMLIMQPMLIATEDNFQDMLAMNLYIATGGLGPAQEEVQLEDTTVTNRSIAWQTVDDKETHWFKLSAFGELSTQLAELPNGTPTIAVGKVSSSTKDDKTYLNYSLEKVLYLPKGTRSAPKKAADPEKGKVAANALGSINFDL